MWPSLPEIVGMAVCYIGFVVGYPQLFEIADVSGEVGAGSYFAVGLCNLFYCKHKFVLDGVFAGCNYNLHIKFGFFSVIPYYNLATGFYVITFFD